VLGGFYILAETETEKLFVASRGAVLIVRVGPDFV